MEHLSDIVGKATPGDKSWQSLFSGQKICFLDPNGRLREWSLQTPWELLEPRRWLTVEFYARRWGVPSSLWTDFPGEKSGFWIHLMALRGWALQTAIHACYLPDWLEIEPRPCGKASLRTDFLGQRATRVPVNPTLTAAKHSWRSQVLVNGEWRDITCCSAALRPGFALGFCWQRQ